MKQFYPYIPKTNVKLAAGQFWPIKLLNGNYACGIILDIPPKGTNTKTFFAALLNWSGAEKPTIEKLENHKLEILEQGKAHIKSITGQGEAIEGKIDLNTCKIEMKCQVDSIEYDRYLLS